MPETPLTTIGDEAIEARIVAWVLGEASAFEIAELERLCEERPELMIFKRRMAAVHGMIGEAEMPTQDDTWKLSPEKRKVVQQILGEEPIRLEVTKETRIRFSARRAMLAIAACLVLTVVILQMMPKQHTSQAVIEVRPRATPMSPLGPAMSEKNGRMMTSQFFGTEFEKIKSRNSLEKVVEKLDLAERWGTDKEQAIDELKKRVQTQNIRGTDLLAIKVKDRDKATADEIAREVTFAYQQYRDEIEYKDAEQQLRELSKTVRDQEDKVEERRKVLATIARTKNVNASSDLAANDSRESLIQKGLDSQDLADAKREFETEAGLLATMKTKLMGETISRKIPGSSVEIHELPGGQTQSEQPMALASREPMKSLRTKIPQELLEGTPKPMVLPGQTPSTEMSAPADRSGAVNAMAMQERKVQTSTERKPSAPSTSMTKVVVGSAVSGVTIPVPEVDVATPSLAFGDDDQFGGGWGDASSAGGGFSGAPTDGLRSGDATIVPGSISNMAEVREGGLKEDLSKIIDHQPPAEEAVAEAQKLRKVGKYDEARDTSEEALAAAPGDQDLRNELAALDAPARTNPALSYEQTQNVDKVRRGLYKAEGNINLGKYDDAKKEYENVLRTDPYNSAARRGMEKLAAARSDYYRAAYDHTRAELLTEVDQAWELAVPEVGEDSGIDALDQKNIPLIGRLFKEGALPEELTKAIREQEDKVEERRKVLATIVRTKGIVYKWNDSSQDQGASSAVNVYHTLEQQKAQLESQITSLDKYGSDQLLVYASGLDLPDNAIRQMYPQYQQAQRQLESYRVNGLSESHPTVKDAQSKLDIMKRQLDESVVNLRATLKAQSDLVEERLKKVEAMKDESREELIRQGLDTQDYEAAKKEFEREQALLQQMRLKLIEQTIQPKPDLTQLIEEISAAEEPYSTFSLNISDASFRIAQAAMAKGERPDPSGVKVEQFYNAVDYGDPSPRAGEPVACFIEQSAHPVIPGRNLVRVAMKTAAAGRSAAQPLRLTLLVDQSGSMTRADRRTAMDTAMRSLGTLLTENDLVTVIGFSRTPRLLADGMKGDEVSGKLAGLVNQSASEGGTNLEEAIKLAEQKAMGQKLAGAQNRIVLFTDGAANLGDADPQRLAAKVEQLRQQGIAFDIAGIAADDLNDELLGELARKGNGRYSVVGKGEEQDFAKQLAGAFRPAAENVKVQVRFNPERVARYKLIGFEKDRLKTEDFRNDAVDAAELAAEEAGVAIYQVEPLPEGRGEIGEVSVRFRDTASGEMVERMWTMAHDPATPAADSAAPSMQLAVLAMLAGEKLKGGPLAEAIDFKQLAEPQATVKQAFGQDTRVAEMLQMVEALK